ncbi:ankyrin repeat domain-containing protein [Polaribacter sp. 20A6]|uniref:ankyrin repeat domain-containing protein n=1 Tax=Polaribacter sp. 20A6 TaxID=2687289 RepID=UPI0013FE0BCC|nr:ankyrin repeat domain-containing protein [Polaribacter sp. 20A6]
MNILNTFFDAIQSVNINVIETLLKRFPKLANAQDKRGFTPLVFATYFDKIEIAETLIKHNANVNHKDAKGNTALLGVAFKGNVDIAKLLLKNNANINAQNNLGYTPLIFATMYNQPKMVAFLLEQNADLSLKDKENKSALDSAKTKDFTEIISLLETQEATYLQTF